MSHRNRGQARSHRDRLLSCDQYLSGPFVIAWLATDMHAAVVTDFTGAMHATVVTDFTGAVNATVVADFAGAMDAVVVANFAGAMDAMIVTRFGVSAAAPGGG
jgi:hypothetical protein